MLLSYPARSQSPRKTRSLMNDRRTNMTFSGLYLLLTVYPQDWACAALYLRGKFDVVKNLFIKQWALLSLMFKTQSFYSKLLRSSADLLTPLWMWSYIFFCDGCHLSWIIEYPVFILQFVALYRPRQCAPWQMVCRRCLVLSGCLVYLLLKDPALELPTV